MSYAPLRGPVAKASSRPSPLSRPVLTVGRPVGVCSGSICSSVPSVRSRTNSRAGRLGLRLPTVTAAKRPSALSESTLLSSEPLAWVIRPVTRS
ncbi:hypothetical protein ADK47_30090 [Streptomyces rimosus subsp. rimosus]|nr:hypothetical protein ADK84_03455 [Streptomyces sp. NRRL WC-3701]KOT52969.1 hypothetical protein ADK44_30065 [Streptomyces rimosus subsp. rimosus]QDA02778.1 hypothetical protein CTZ40_02255 [Streptomyces rimosus]KOT70440.1 hypothetical protein ADK48_39240 [Streptomyces rimosus subsp. rimosus]KOT71998.1 hypothetical protein ADK47_30090 [Streptomyces rimosus subsp. rimosus]